MFGLYVIAVGCAPDRMAATDIAADGGWDGSDGSVDAYGSDAAPDVELLPKCHLDELAHAPPPSEVDGLDAVPIDIETVDAVLELDGYAQRAEVTVTVRFRLGPQGGMPILDLRQTIETAELDGVSVPPYQLAHHGFAAESFAQLRVLERELSPCSTHTLKLEYRLARPDARDAPPLGWDAASAAIRWDFTLADRRPARYLEQWFPANLIYDHFAISLELVLHGDTDHTLITNAEVSELARHHWLLEFPPHYTALSPMLVLWPSAELTSETTTEQLSTGQTVDIELHRYTDVPHSMASLLSRTIASLEKAIAHAGEYPHGERLTVFFRENSSRSMEYDGGTTTRVEALEHEIFHLWCGRGMKPALGRDGWLDEAWTTYNTGAASVTSVQEKPRWKPPVTLSVADPYSRYTPAESYDEGSEFFSHLAFLMGRDELRTAMADFLVLHMLDVFTTKELEQHLYCANEDPRIAEAFHRWVYGHDRDLSPNELPSCP